MRAQKISLSYGDRALLDEITFEIKPRDRIAIIGRNGVGKSTLLKIIDNEIQPDSGNIKRNAALITAQLQQQVPKNPTGTILEFVLKKQIKMNEWDGDYQAQTVISQLGLDETMLMSALSGGQIRRALLAAALVNEPDILLLDEPTNHLDIESIIWLERFVRQYPKAVITITHDRVFMQKIANRIFEIDRGQLITWDGSYNDFLIHKENELGAEATANKNFDKKLAQEEVWIRQGIKARRTRNEGRVRALEQMRRDRSQRRERRGNIAIEKQTSDQSGKTVIELDNISVSYDNKTLINQFSANMLRGDKIGIIGPNGCGKSTLIKTLLQEINPDEGGVKHGTKLEIAYFDQHRSHLDPEQTALDNISQGREFITLNGKNKHIISYLQDFLFTPEKSRSLVKSLSGGECNRLMLAKLFSKPANFLILDEPTNDLDQETLELLEEHLLQFDGSLLVVSHDRALLNNVITSSWVFEQDGHIQEYVGGYDDWQRQKGTPMAATSKEKVVKSEQKLPKAKKLSYKDQRELEALPERISSLETAIKSVESKMADPDFYQQDRRTIDEETNKLTELNKELETAFDRWETLDTPTEP
jgi:ABC transport system ATP-binding/permease protein